jgi:Ran GTPase-activating protein (RanGAP) involved in mRNA processing and transport
MDITIQRVKDNKAATIDVCGNRVIRSFHTHSVQGNFIGTIAVRKLSEALKSTTSLTKLNLSCKKLVAVFHSHKTDNNIGNEGTIKLAEALKLNTSLTSLDLSRNREICLVSF